MSEETTLFSRRFVSVRHFARLYPHCRVARSRLNKVSGRQHRAVLSGCWRVGRCGQWTVESRAGVYRPDRTDSANYSGSSLRGRGQARPAFLDRGFLRLVKSVSPRWIYFTLIVVLGLLYVYHCGYCRTCPGEKAIASLKLDRTSEIAAVVLACFSIGLGAALTPIGEPVGTIAVAALRADFWYLVRLLGPLILTGILIVSGIKLVSSGTIWRITSRRSPSR